MPDRPPGRPVAFLSDYGTRDGFPAACRAVLLAAAPAGTVLDLTHDVPRHDVRHGATVLARVVPLLPPAVVLAVVDPGVGTARVPVALAAGPHLLVGPDNGLLLPAADAVGGVTAAHAIAGGRIRGDRPPARTFDGRDVFAPAAALLAGRVPLADLGPAVDPRTLVRLPPLRRVRDGAVLRCEVGYVDGFGNVQLAGTAADVPAPGTAVEVTTPTGRRTAVAARTFGDVAAGCLLVYADSDGRPALAVRDGDAAARLRVGPGDVVGLAPAGTG